MPLWVKFCTAPIRHCHVSAYSVQEILCEVRNEYFCSELHVLNSASRIESLDADVSVSFGRTSLKNTQFRFQNLF